jgi:hypothetical protein
MNRNSPYVRTAEIMFSEKRRPVACATGVWPFGAQVVRVW